MLKTLTANAESTSLNGWIALNLYTYSIKYPLRTLTVKHQLHIQCAKMHVFLLALFWTIKRLLQGIRLVSSHHLDVYSAVVIEYRPEKTVLLSLSPAAFIDRNIDCIDAEEHSTQLH